MSLPKMTTAVDNISKLDTRPNAVNGLTADELKAKFDKAPEDIKRFLNEVLIPALDGAITLDALGAVPETRKVNGQALSADVTVSAEDVPAFGPDQLKRTTQYLLDELADGVSKAVPKTRRVAGKMLDKDIALAAEDIGYSKAVGGVTVEGTVKTELTSLNSEMNRKVPTTRKVNGKPLSADVTLGAADIDYAGTISGAANVKEALEALNAKKDVAVFSATLSGETLSSAATFPEISAAYSAGKQVLLKVDTSGGIYWLLPLVRFLGGMVASFAAWVSNSRLAVATLSYNAASTPPVNAWSLTQVPLSAESVAYSATIDGTAVANVKAALDALAVGNPLDTTVDYTESGATSVEQWATMAKVVNGVASTSEYRVAAGRYRIVDNDNSDGRDVTIMDVPADPQRIVLISSITVDPFWYFDVYKAAAPGSDPISLLELSTEENLLMFTDGCVKLLPGYNKSADSNDADKILMLKSKTIAGNTNVYPSWGSLPMATASAAGGIKADAKTEDDTVPVRIDTDGKLWANGQGQADWQVNNPVDDAYVLNRPGGYYTTPSAAYDITWDGTKKTGDERVEAGSFGDYKLCFYYVSNKMPKREELIGGKISTGEAELKITDKSWQGTPELDSDECIATSGDKHVSISDWENEYVEITYEADTPKFHKAGTWFFVVENANGNPVSGVTKLQTVAVGDIVKIPRKFLDLPIPTATAADAGKIVTVGADGNYALTKSQLLPEVTAADNGKFARVVNGAWAAQALTNVSEVGA